MSAATEVLIHQKLAAVLAEVEAITKDRTNQAQNFKFRGVDDVFNELHARFGKHGLYVRPEVVHFEQTERSTSNNKAQLHSVVKMRYHFIAAADGSSVSMEIPGEAADSGDKGLGKACQYAYKLLLLQMFLIPTEGDNDPDAHSTEWAGRPAQEQRSGAGRGRAELPQLRAVPPTRGEIPPDEVKAIAPWLTQITQAGAKGWDADLDAVCQRLTDAVERGGLVVNPAQDKTLRRAIEAARLNIETRRNQGEAAPDELPPAEAQRRAAQKIQEAAGERPRGKDGYADD